MLSVIHGRKGEKQTTTLRDLSWIGEAMRFGHWLTDQALHYHPEQRLFAFVSSPTLSCLPGFILLGAILRNRLSVSRQQEEDQRRIPHFLRIWEAGEGSELTGPERKHNKRPFDRYRIVQLRRDELHHLGVRLKPNLFRANPDLISRIADYRVVVEKWHGRGGPQFEMSVESCLGYALKNEKTSYERILEDLSTIVGIQPTAETCSRLPLFLVGPTRKHLQTLYAEDVLLVQDTGNDPLALTELLNLDTDGRTISPPSWNDGAWLNPRARREKPGVRKIAERGVAILDGASAWERWSEPLQRSTRIVVFPRSSSNLRHERMRTILTQVRANLGTAFTCEGHPWFKDFQPIRAFVHEWR